MRGQAKRIAGLRELAALRGWEDGELDELCRRAERYDVAAGEELITQGRRGGEVYLLLAGKAQVVRDGLVVDELVAGAWFGELAVLDPGPRAASVCMTESGTVLELTSPCFFALLNSAPVLARRLLAGLAQRLHIQNAAVPA